MASNLSLPVYIFSFHSSWKFFRSLSVHKKKWGNNFHYCVNFNTTRFVFSPKNRRPVRFKAVKVHFDVDKKFFKVSSRAYKEPKIESSLSLLM